MKSSPQNLESGTNKIGAICEILRKEAIAPSEVEAEKILAAAHAEAKRIVHHAEEEKKRLIENAKEHIRKEENIFASSLRQAAKQALASLRQQIVDQFFSPALADMVSGEVKKVDVAANLIRAIVESLEKEGFDGNVEAYVGKAIDPKEVAKVLSQKVVDRLQSKAISVGDFEGGIVISQKERKMKIDASSQALVTLLADNLKNPEFRKIIFSQGEP